MASERILEQKKAVVEEIKNKLDNSKTFLLIDYRGLTVSEITELRRSLREMGSDIKVYKNTLMNLALKDKNIKLDDFMEGPNAYLSKAIAGIIKKPSILLVIPKTAEAITPNLFTATVIIVKDIKIKIPWIEEGILNFKIILAFSL